MIIRRVSISVFLMGILLLGQTVWAATYYVRTGGSDSNSGTTDTNGGAWRTLGKAANTMVAGDMTLVHGGTYSTETAIRFARSGSLGNPITLKNFPGEFPVVAWSSQTDSDHRIYVSHASGTDTAMSDIVVEGLELKDGFEGFKLEGTLRMIIRRCSIHNMWNQGIQASAAGGHKDGTIDRNKIYHNGDPSGPNCNGDPDCVLKHGLYLTGANWTITNNLIYDNMTFGLQANSQTATASPNAATYSGFSGLVAHNVFAYQRNRAGIVLWHNNADITGLTIENNIFYENSQNIGSSQAFSYTSGCTSGCTATIRNNIYYSTGSGTAFSSGTCNNCTVTGTINANPSMVNAPATVPASPNFSLQSSSPAIDAGVTVPRVTVDFAGIPRPQGPSFDIGAYEGAARSDATPPTPPRDLTVF